MFKCIFCNTCNTETQQAVQHAIDHHPNQELSWKCDDGIHSWPSVIPQKLKEEGSMLGLRERFLRIYCFFVVCLGIVLKLRDKQRLNCLSNLNQILVFIVFTILRIKGKIS